ncbi:MAG: KEOPS complex kinase/ATPase Bud32 [Candidatus Micrarchaeales archaeon]
MKIQKLSEGAESEIYSLKFLGFDSVLKKRIRKRYRVEELDRNIRVQRTRNEARIIGMMSSLGVNAPSLLLLEKYDIIMTRLYGTNLNNLLDSDSGINFDKIFSSLGKYIAILHNNEIAHGDFTPANVILDKNRNVYLIDFGLSEITNSIEDKALDILLMKRSVDVRHFGSLIKSYKSICRCQKDVLDRLAEIEKRGRYNTRTLLA